MMCPRCPGMFLIGSCRLSWFPSFRLHWGAGLFLTIKGASATCAAWQADRKAKLILFPCFKLALCHRT